MTSLSCQGNTPPDKKSPRPVPQAEYTNENPGQWADLVSDHVPHIEVNLNKANDNVLVYVILKKPTETHYIEKIGIMDEKQKKVLAEVSFKKDHKGSYNAWMTIKPLDSARLNELKAYARCSQHDLWTAPLASARIIKTQ